MTEKVVDFTNPEELRFTIPEVLREAFAKEPRLLIKLRSPAGLMPIDIGVLRDTDWLKKWAGNPEFTQNYEIVVMAKQQMT